MLLPQLSLLGMLGGVTPPVPVIEEELKGGHRIYDPDKPQQYEELSQQTIDALFPPQPVTVSESALTPEMMAAVLAWMEED